METTKNPDVQNVRMPVRHDLTIEEIAKEAKNLAALTRVRERKESEFNQLQKQWKTDDAKLGLDIDAHRDRIEQGWEMRATDCTIHFNDPSEGKKTIVRVDTGAVVSVEEMNGLDLERELPLPREERKAIAREVTEDDALPLDGSLNAANNEGLSTNLGDALGASVAGTSQVQVVMPDFEKDDWGAKSLRVAFKKAADKAGWPLAAIETLLEQCKGTDAKAIKRTLLPHVKGANGPASCPDAPADYPFGHFNGHYHVSVWGFIEPLKVATDLPAEMHADRKLEALSDDLKNAAIYANWPDAAKTYLAHCIEGATLEELLALANRLKGSEVQP